ncbi:MAG: ribbon-helix-helix domain-containing protein [Gemmatimonadota bacterium]
MGMKTAISIPDDLFDRAEKLARRTSRSRSQLYADAVREYIARYSPDAVTDAMDSVIEQVGHQTDAFTKGPRGAS